jgi:hypothetical protein
MGSSCEDMVGVLETGIGINASSLLMLLLLDWSLPRVGELTYEQNRTRDLFPKFKLVFKS